METTYPTITNEPPPEDEEDLLTIPQEDFSAPINPQDIEEARPYTSAPINPQDIRIQQRRDFLAQPVMSDAEAGQTYQRLPFMEDTERKGALAKLDRYTADLDERDDRFHANERAYEFTNPNARTKWLDQPEVRNNLGYLEDSNAAFDRMAVKKFLETTVLKRPLNSDAEYEAERNNFVGRIMTGKPKVSDTEAFQTVKASVEREQQLNVVTSEAAGLMLQKYVQGAISGTDVQVGDVYNEVSKKNAELVQGYEGQLYQGLQAIKLDFDATLGRNKEAIGVFANFIQKDMSGIATPEDQAAAQQAFLSVDKKDRADVMRLLEKGLAAGDEESEWFKRGWNDLKKVILNPLGVTSLAKQQMSVGRDWEYNEALDKLKAGKEGRMGLSGEIVFPTPEELKKFPDAYRKLTKEETVAAIKDFETRSEFNDINRQLTGLKEATYNKYQGMFPKDFLWGLPKAVELGAYGFQQQIAPMAFAMTGGQVGKLLYTTAVAPAYYEDWMRENPTANKTVAMTGSILSAYAESWLEGFQGLTAVGESVFKKYLLTLRNGGAKAFLKLTLGGFAEEMIEENTQNATTILIGRMTQDIALAIDPNVDPGKVQNAAEMLQDWKDQIGPTAAMMIWPAITGAGIGSYKHLKNPIRQVFNEDTLRRWGITPDKIDKILSEPDWDKRQALLEEATAGRTKTNIADGIAYSAEQDRKAQQDEQAKVDQGHPQVTLEAVTTPDGERRYNVLDPEGNVVRESLPAEEALNEVASLQQQVDLELIAQQAEQTAGEEAVARNVQAEAVWEQLKPEDKTTAANIVEFSYAKPTTPEEQQRLATIQGVVAARNKQFGTTEAVQLASADVPTTRAGVGAANFISWFEGTFGKRVQFVASGDGKPLSFGGLVVSTDPNTIFLDVAGDRNILSLVGHEWSHTLETTNPKLWADVVSQIKPLVVDWAKALGRIDKSYSADQATPEFIANVMGDAFGDPDFWAKVKQQDPSLFQRLVAAIKEWFDTITDRASEYKTQAPDIIKDWEGIRNIVAAAMERAHEGPEVPMTQFSGRREEVEPAPQPKAGPVTITAFDLALMQFAEREVQPSTELARQLKEEARIYEQILNCLS